MPRKRNQLVLTRERAFELVKEVDKMRADGETVLNSCRLVGVFPSTYYWWKHKITGLATKTRRGTPYIVDHFVLYSNGNLVNIKNLRESVNE